MKTGWKAVLWSIPVVISIFALIVATSYKTAVANTASWSPFFAAIPVGLGNFLSNRLVLFLLTASVFSFLSNKITRFVFSRRIDAAYQQGVADSTPAENILGSIVAQAQPTSTKRPLYPPSIDQLTYAIREVVSALSEPGILDDETVGRNMGKIKQEGPVWHIAANYNLRKSFIGVVDRALAARQDKGNAVYHVTGDYEPETRDHHVKSLKNCSDKLIDHLNNQASRMKVRTVV